MRQYEGVDLTSIVSNIRMQDQIVVLKMKLFEINYDFTTFSPWSRPVHVICWTSRKWQVAAPVGRYIPICSGSPASPEYIWICRTSPSSHTASLLTMVHDWLSVSFLLFGSVPKVYGDSASTDV